MKSIVSGGPFRLLLLGFLVATPSCVDSNPSDPAPSLDANLTSPPTPLSSATPQKPTLPSTQTAAGGGGGGGYAYTSCGNCDDGNPCTADTCVNNACVHTFLANNTPCDDRNPCTQTDICTSGVCAGTTISGCVAAQCTLDTPHIDGIWHTLPYLMPISPILATLLHTGKILIVAGSENDAANTAQESSTYRVAQWDYQGTTASSVSVQTIDYDVFCSGAAVLPDGRPLIVGGTGHYSNFTGDNRATIFDPV